MSTRMMPILVLAFGPLAGAAAAQPAPLLGTRIGFDAAAAVHSPPETVYLESVFRALPANHGPGTSGAGVSVLSGDTLRAGGFSIDLREDFTQFEHFDRRGAEQRALQNGSAFDALHRSYVTSLALAYGLTDDLQVGVQLGYYIGEDFIDAHLHDGHAAVGQADPEGFMDTWITAKYRVMRGQAGNLAILGGIKLPTGREEIMLDNDHRLEPSSAPGSGSVDFQAGAGYSRFLTPRMTLDAGGLYTFRTEHDDFEVGDRFDLGVAIGYRLTEEVTRYPQWSVFGEISAVFLQKDSEGNEDNPNSGGTTLYLTPGGRVRFSEHVALTAGPSFPVVQDLNGDQVEVEWKLAATLSFSF